MVTSTFRPWTPCPDFFELDGKYVLLTSPQDMLPSGFEYHNGNGTLCLIGDFDGKTFLSWNAHLTKPGSFQRRDRQRIPVLHPGDHDAPAIIHQRRCQVPQSGGCITFRMILDRFSVEIFVNTGTAVRSGWTALLERSSDQTRELSATR